MSLAELKARAAAKGLAVSGTKAILQQRLNAVANWTCPTPTTYTLSTLPSPLPSLSALACYDIDGTLITPTAEGAVFCESENDWKFRDGMLEHVKGEAAKGKTILLFSNQGRKVLRHITLGRIENVVKALPPCAVFVATAKDEYRKPAKGMWDLAVNTYSLTPSADTSFFCGDASGLIGSHSADDKGFADACNIPFLLPLGYGKGAVAIPLEEMEEQEMVIMVGAPATGKSTAVAKYLPSYTVASKDLHKGKDLVVAREALLKGKSVVIDNTNPCIASRAPYIALAKEVGVPVRCVVMSTPLVVAMVRNSAREKVVPLLVYNMYRGKYKTPVEGEGVSVQWL